MLYTRSSLTERSSRLVPGIPSDGDHNARCDSIKFGISSFRDGSQMSLNKNVLRPQHIHILNRVTILRYCLE